MLHAFECSTWMCNLFPFLQKPVILLNRFGSKQLRWPLPWSVQTTFQKKDFRSTLHKTNKKHSRSRMVGCCLIIHSLRMLPPNRQAGVGSGKKHQVSPSDQYRHPVWHQENYSIGWISPPASCNILSTSPWRSLKNDPIHVECFFYLHAINEVPVSILTIKHKPSLSVLYIVYHISTYKLCFLHAGFWKTITRWVYLYYTSTNLDSYFICWW